MDVDEVARRPVLLLLGHDLRGHAAVGRGQVHKAHVLLIPDRKGTHHVIDVQTVEHARREALEELQLGERDVDDVGALVHLAGVGVVAHRDVVAHHGVPIDGAYNGVDVGGGVSQGVKTAHKTAHAGARHKIDRDALLLQIFKDTDVSGSFGTAAGEHQGHRGTIFLLSDFGHPLLHLPEKQRIRPRVVADVDQLVGLGENATGKQSQQGRNYQ